MKDEPDTRKYFHWSKPSLRDECIKLAIALAEVTAERDELKNVVNALEKEVSAYVDSLLKALRERDGLREALNRIGPISGISLGSDYVGKITEKEAIALVNAVICSMLEVEAAALEG
jgi:SMC interacting uncharacterized protein involved in chromosome segregation